jgi:hypothetical protein
MPLTLVINAISCSSVFFLLQWLAASLVESSLARNLRLSLVILFCVYDAEELYNFSIVGTVGGPPRFGDLNAGKDFEIVIDSLTARVVGYSSTYVNSSSS